MGLSLSGPWLTCLCPASGLQEAFPHGSSSGLSVQPVPTPWPPALCFQMIGTE